MRSRRENLKFRIPLFVVVVIRIFVDNPRPLLYDSGPEFLYIARLVICRIVFRVGDHSVGAVDKVVSGGQG